MLPIKAEYERRGSVKACLSLLPAHFDDVNAFRVRNDKNCHIANIRTAKEELLG
jgi:hypothetical protein